jgi:hypothetical protein
MFTACAPLSEACAMSMLTRGAGNDASGTDVCPGIGFEGSDCFPDGFGFDFDADVCGAAVAVPRATGCA